ncbi:hypothetical protein B7C51_08885 [Paenibacillus larvae subsp. pulvifaciens]|uniref:Uncharacterized protein n=2 Tax=Paenibacillus larvae TaxID=1464 RepID=A0A1V0URL3_9BACL|nr:hypothetical protein B7C51_08885 [Paenibacillus larvae subsp. pulvifaciens]QHZ53457.1 hypothetical protein ERICV_04411 [Paenibacillus larvae subsp. larvae]
MVQAFVHGFVLVFTEPSCDPGYNRCYRNQSLVYERVNKAVFSLTCIAVSWLWSRVWLWLE